MNPSTVKLFLDGTLQAATVGKIPPITTITHTPSPGFEPGSTHTLRVESKDQLGVVATNQANFSLPAPVFPLTGLGGPAGGAGTWGLRQIWNAGRADALVSAVGIALQSGQPTFAGNVQDDAVPVINFIKSANPGGGGYMPDDQPLPAEAAGLTTSDFVLVARGQVKIPRAGDWTIGVHSDEGFALRFIGAPFDSATGNGIRDENFPEFIYQQNNTTDSSTRAVLKNLPAGTYPIEFISWERVGAANYEIYAAEGAFAEDADTDQWFLIGAEGGLELVAARPDLSVLGITRTGNLVVVDFSTTVPGLAYQLEESTDLKAWSKVANASLTNQGNGRVRATTDNATAAIRFYRIALP